MGQLNRVLPMIALAAVFLAEFAQAEPAKPVVAAPATVVTTAAPVVQEATPAPAPVATPAPSAPVAVAATPTPAPSPVVNVVPVKTVYVAENQPVQIIDNQGRLLQIIYLKRK